jgi:aspartyl-tRNA(Asn)/glutamyl-tRNA(Gln) amidotransferase subunit B
MRYADVSDCNLYYGNMRFDVNVSISNGRELGTRTETKNLNSFRAVEKAVEYEIKRQTELLQKGQKITQETRGWDDAKQKTFTQRIKENAEDYRYMPDPDLPPVELTADMIDTVKSEMPPMPAEWRTRLAALGLDNAQTNTLLMGELDEPATSYLSLIEAVLSEKALAKAIANWAVNLEIPLRRDGMVKSKLDSEGRLHLYRVVFALVQADKLSSSNAKLLLTKLLSQTEIATDIEHFAKQHNLIQESDAGEIEKIVQRVIDENPKAAQDVVGGEAKAIGFLTGQVMKHSQGRANPALAQELIKKQLGL